MIINMYLNFLNLSFFYCDSTYTLRLNVELFNSLRGKPLLQISASTYYTEITGKKI